MYLRGLSYSSFNVDNFQWFLLKLVQTCFCLFSKQPNLQPKKRSLNYSLQGFLINFFFFLWCDNGYLAEGLTEVTISVKQSWIFVLSHYFNKDNMLMFFSTLTFFTKVAILAASGGYFIHIRPTCCKHQNLFMTVTNILGFLLNFSSSSWSHGHPPWRKLTNWPCDWHDYNKQSCNGV